MSTEKTTDEILAEKLAAKALKAAKAEEAAKLSQIEELDLEERFEAELGPRGQSFDIIDATPLGEGFLVLKVGIGANHKRFETACSKAKHGPSEPDLYNFVTPCLVHPLDGDPGTLKSLTTFKAIIDRRPSLLTRCAAVLLDLYGQKKASDTQG